MKYATKMMLSTLMIAAAGAVLMIGIGTSVFTAVTDADVRTPAPSAMPNTVPNAYAALPEQPSLGVGFDPSAYNANEVSYYSREGNTCKPLRRFF